MSLRFTGALSLIATHSSTSHRCCCRDSFLTREGLTRKYRNHKDISQSETIMVLAEVECALAPEEQAVGKVVPLYGPLQNCLRTISGILPSPSATRATPLRTRHIIRNYKAYPYFLSLSYQPPMDFLLERWDRSMPARAPSASASDKEIIVALSWATESW